MAKLDFIKHDLKNLKEQGLLIKIRTIESPQGAWIIVDGKKVLNMCSNNYLGFGNHEKLREAAKKGLDEYG
ncbi:MAG TPA: 8-amino-7-oxononanoate synthase, partial [Bacteroidetes bacterium]|nr:8-amino-7-oxononanoate synthase [Bacteroidota bacterium]